MIQNKNKTLRPVHANAGITAAYQRRIDAMIDEMQTSISYWITRAYAAKPPELAQDESPAAALRALMRKLSTRWQRNFDEAAPRMAEYFATAAYKRTDAALQSILKDAGFSVEFKLTATANDVLQATIGENVGLIKSIASEHLSDVEGLVMRAVAKGGDLKTLSTELHQRYGVTKRRAAFIARDQNNKATANITRVRQQSLGITEAIWMHSGGGREPRPSHVAFDGKRYEIAKGAFIDGEWIYPGQLPNCRCVSRSVIPGL